MQRRTQKLVKKLGAALGALILVWLTNVFEKGTDNGSQDHQNDPSKKVVFTRHAKCRMGCRKIDAEEVSDVIANGRKNPRKSDANAKPCPVVSMEKVTKDQQKVRVVFGNCPTQNKIITVIDLRNKYSCKCD